MTEHIYYMQKVLELTNTIGVQTRPNPKVACILVKNSRIIGTGIHLNKGSEHAEIYALNQAGNNAKDATLYVNLEPCSHYGATPPCADAIIKYGVKTVVIANDDPNPLVSGQGIQKLKDAGIEVITNVLANEAQQINQVFFHNITQNLPYITLKVGMSIDGRIATKDNLSKWITGIESRTNAHHYRAENEGILIGVDSVIKDDPNLTPYLVDGHINSPIRIILDSSLRTPIDAKLITDNSAKTWVITNSQNNLNKFEKFSHVKIIQMPTMDIKSILHELYKNGIYTLMVEGGEKIYSSLIDAKLVNQIVTYISPQIIGSTNAKHFIAGNGFGDLVQNLKCKIISSCQLGNDLKVVYEVIN
jgi:diaminohydroxyphosphoribosylaminopyrimidine deaminase/5-amino-6-(5-phosphoribosylamino)uracil reductase